MTEFFMAMIPPTVTHQEKKWRVLHGKPVSYEPPELKEARAKLTAHLARHKPPEKYTGPIYLQVIWCFPCGENHHPGEYRKTKPDTDNLQKLLKDCMTDVGFWKDDAQVVDLRVVKIYSEKASISISYEELPEVPND